MNEILHTSHSLTENSEKIFGINKRWIELIHLLVQRDLRVRYRGSVLGYLWSMLNPLLYMIILSLVFSHIAKVKTEDYALFILAGIMTWNFFHQSINIGMNSIVGSAHLLKKVSIPGLLFPTASVFGVLINFVLSFIPFILISLGLGHGLSYKMLFVPLFMVIYFGFVWGAATTIATINVKYRDVGHAMESFMQMLFYATPVVYPASTLPDKYRFIIDLNPMSYFIAIFRGLLISNEFPTSRQIITVCLFSFASSLIGYLIYQKYREEFIYSL